MCSIGFRDGTLSEFICGVISLKAPARGALGAMVAAVLAPDIDVVRAACVLADGAVVGDLRRSVVNHQALICSFKVHCRYPSARCETSLLLALQLHYLYGLSR